MSIDLHDALTTLVATAPRSEPPTTTLIRRVHRRRASRAMTTSAVGVVAAGAAATSGLGWWSDPPRTPAPENDYHATPATEMPAPAGSTAVWDLHPGASIDVGTAPTRTVTEALAAMTVEVPLADGTDMRPQLFLMDGADGAWVRPTWDVPDSAWLRPMALSPDGRTIAAWAARPGERPGVDLVDIASGERTPVSGLEADGERCYPSTSDFTPDGSALAVLAVCDLERGPAVVFAVDPAVGVASVLATVEGTNLAEGGNLEYSPDGTLLAIASYDLDEPYTARASVVDASGTLVREWPAALRSQTVWYGNDALRASGLEQDDEGEWTGWLIPSTGAAVGEIRPYDEQPREFGPAPARLGATHGQELRAHTTTADEAANPAGATPWTFDIEDTATGMVRAWLPVFDSTAPADRQPTVAWTADTLAHRTR